MSDFKALVERAGKEVFVHLSGIIDESAVLPLLDLKGSESLFIDLKMVKAINSVGIQSWLEWTKIIDDQVNVTLDHVHDAIVFQFNMIEGFLPPKTRVRSLYIPYYCEKCDAKVELLLEQVPKDISAVIDFEDKALKRNLCKTKNFSDCEIECDVRAAKYLAFAFRK
jgi:hypothetical protein